MRLLLEVVSIKEIHEFLESVLSTCIGNHMDSSAINPELFKNSQDCLLIYTLLTISFDFPSFYATFSFGFYSLSSIQQQVVTAVITVAIIVPKAKKIYLHKHTTGPACDVHELNEM